MMLAKKSSEGTERVFFITFLRALAACLITNSHYIGVYPVDIIANGGLVGDVLFFTVSGYCLYNVKQPFHRWYGTRITRVYIPVLIATIIFVLIGTYKITPEKTVLWWLVYPTYYHFVASIIVLYIPFYFIMRHKPLQNRLLMIMGIIAIVYILVYILFYDKSYYHIDTVREPMIRFLFFESMLLGAWFRQKGDISNIKHKWLLMVGTSLCFTIYIASKYGFLRNFFPSSLQIVNQFVIFALLFLLFGYFQSMSYKLEKLKKPFKYLTSLISDMTLEIYLVQYVLIGLISPHLSFPVNWIAITSAILISAFALHIVCEPLSRTASCLVSRKFTSNENKVVED